MQEKFTCERNVEFMLYEVFDALHLTQYPYFKEYDRESFDQFIQTSLRIAKNLLPPKRQQKDKDPSQFIDGEIRVNPIVKTKAFHTCSI